MSDNAVSLNTDSLMHSAAHADECPTCQAQYRTITPAEIAALFDVPLDLVQERDDVWRTAIEDRQAFQATVESGRDGVWRTAIEDRQAFQATVESYVCCVGCGVLLPPGSPVNRCGYCHA